MPALLKPQMSGSGDGDAGQIASRASHRMWVYARLIRLDLPPGARAMQVFSDVMRNFLVTVVDRECDQGEVIADHLGRPSYSVTWEGVLANQLPAPTAARITGTLHGRLEPATPGEPWGATRLYREPDCLPGSRVGRVTRRCRDKEVVAGAKAGTLFIVSIAPARGEI